MNPMHVKPIVFIILFITSGTLYYDLTDAAPSLESYSVTRVIDGDTLILSTNQKVRLKGINTPEKNMPHYQEAKDFLQNAAQNKSIQIQSYGTDKYGRILAHILIDDKSINAKILQNGLATLYYYEHDAHYEEYAKAEEFARLNEKGLWKKSSDAHCIKLIELKTDEPESLILKNNCDKELSITFKDDATHVYHEIIKPKLTFTKTFSHIWNTDGDSIYIRDNKGLLLFHRY
jgi:endonuclease YncB( thermonuclease family)